jgi:DNA invertase Pin-like site-specific DNA recombinase
MSIGKVTVWQMTEEERLAYIAKHPIVPTGETVVSTENIDYKVVNERKKEALDRKGRLIDKVNKDNLHKLFMSGETIPEIAKILDISVSTVNKIIGEQRKIKPDKWPIRSKGRKKE